MHINIGDKLVVTKELVGFFNIGYVVTVTNVTEDGLISFVYGENSEHSGFMDSTTCEEHFEKAVKNLELPTITHEYIADIMSNSEFETYTTFNKCTIVSCRLPNGFVITESSACVSPEDYDVELGEEICIDKIAEKIWELEAYRLQQYLWEEGMVNVSAEDCPYGCDDCANCPCDGEGCDEPFEDEDEDELGSDCDNCDDYKCPHNTNDSLFNTDGYYK